MLGTMRDLLGVLMVPSYGEMPLVLITSCLILFQTFQEENLQRQSEHSSSTGEHLGAYEFLMVTSSSVTSSMMVSPGGKGWTGLHVKHCRVLLCR